tara:strand:- start:1427 stop:2656 length:1230 start_codon:yes stop_codon:yes gene_type:complete
MANQTTDNKVIGLSHAPIFFSFFTWGFGTGAQNLGRPLFAFAATGNIFLVGILLASNAIPRTFTGPLTGFLSDRFGRKPLVILGPTIRGISNVGQFMIGLDDYWLFFALELFGQAGVAMWNTSSNVLLSDVTRTESRARVLAARQMSTRLGFVAGPAVGGVLASVFGLQSVFLLNGLSKIVIVLVVFFGVKETRPARMETSPEKPTRRRLSFYPFKDRTFAVLAIATAAFAMSNAGIMQTLVPVYAIDMIKVDEAAVGFLISVASTVTFLFAYPNGIIADRYGRKRSLVPGLLLLALASFVLAGWDFYTALLVAVGIKGLGEAMSLGTTQTYAMDLAPDHARGAYIGFWTFSQALGATLGPILMAGLYYLISPGAAFMTMAIILILAAVLLALFGRETVGRARIKNEPD